MPSSGTDWFGAPRWGDAAGTDQNLCLRGRGMHAVLPLAPSPHLWGGGGRFLVCSAEAAALLS